MALRLLLIAILCALGLPARAESFAQYLQGLRPQALEAGVSGRLYDQITATLTVDPAIPKLVETQPEFTTPVWDYIDARVSDERIKAGQKAVTANDGLLRRIEKETGVDRFVLAAIWGIETHYGAVLNNSKLIKPIVRSLATLAFQKRGRQKADEADFIAALLLVQRGPLDAAHLVGSWGGAIGHLQVNPANVLAHGRDGDGDGQIDLQDSLADALMTSAHFLLDLGYQPGMDWGFEVEVPADFDWLLADRTQLRPIAFFTARGIQRVKGRRFADEGQMVFLYAPAGAKGPTFLMTGNYLVLKGYNFSDSYALAVAHLADRLRGSGAFVATWPRDTVFPNLAERKTIQARLIALGLLTGEVDGRLGPITSAAYARFQAQNKAVADGFITRRAYEELTAR